MLKPTILFLQPEEHQMKKIKRLLLITPFLSKGGAETQLLKLAQFMKSRDYEVMVISLKPINAFGTDFSNKGFKVLFLKSWIFHACSNWATLRNTVRTFKPDVVLAFMFLAILCSRRLKRENQFRLIASLSISVISKKWLLPFKLSSRMDDTVVFNSESSKARFERLQLVKTGGTVIHNAITVPDQPLLPRKHTGMFTWTCIAHFRWNKDYKTLFKAIALLKDLSFRIEIIGRLNGETWPYQMISDLGIQEHVKIFGFQQDTSRYLRAADAFVLPSNSEEMSSAILEAMAYGKPVVITAIDCNKELIETAGCGLLSEKKQPQDLADKMRMIMTMTSKGRFMLGQNGKRHIESKFDEQQVMEQWFDLMEKNN